MHMLGLKLIHVIKLFLCPYFYYSWYTCNGTMHCKIRGACGPIFWVWVVTSKFCRVPLFGIWTECDCNRTVFPVEVKYPRRTWVHFLEFLPIFIIQIQQTKTQNIGHASRVVLHFFMFKIGCETNTIKTLTTVDWMLSKDAITGIQ